MDFKTVRLVLSYLVSSTIHEDWRSSRANQSSPATSYYNPKWEETKDLKYRFICKTKSTLGDEQDNVLTLHDYVKIDNVNTAFPDLPYDFQYKYLKFSDLAIELIYNQIFAEDNHSLTPTTKELSRLVYSLQSSEQLKIAFSQISDNPEFLYIAVSTVIDILVSYRKGAFNLENIAKTFKIPAFTSNLFDIQTEASVLSIDVGNLANSLNAIYSNNFNEEDLYWNIKNDKQAFLSYIKMHAIDDPNIEASYNEYISYINTRGLHKQIERITRDVVAYESKQKWLVKYQKPSIFTKLTLSYSTKRVEKQRKDYEEAKKFLAFVNVYFSYKSDILKIKQRYNTFIEEGLVTLTFKPEGATDKYKIVLYANGNVYYQSKSLFGGENIALDIYLGEKIVCNLVGFINDDKCIDIIKLADDCEKQVIQLEQNPKISAINNIFKSLTKAKLVAES